MSDVSDVSLFVEMGVPRRCYVAACFETNGDRKGRLERDDQLAMLVVMLVRWIVILVPALFLSTYEVTY